MNSWRGEELTVSRIDRSEFIELPVLYNLEFYTLIGKKVLEFKKKFLYI